MKKAIGNAFQSQFGFSSPGFSVDSAGNIVASSIITQDETDISSAIVDYIITDDGEGFLFSDVESSTPLINLLKGRTYRFRLNLTNFQFFLRRQNQTTPYETGLIHSDGSRGPDALGKSSGTLQISIPAGYTETTIFYTNQFGNIFGTFNILNPAGIFTTVDVQSNTISVSPTTGALTVAGGAGVQGDLYVGGELNLGGIGIPKLSSSTNLDLNATNKIVLQIENINIGYINENGLSIPINSSSITESTIDSTIIGSTFPATAAFTSAVIENDPVNNTDATNKSYVDTTVTALAIALGS